MKSRFSNKRPDLNFKALQMNLELNGHMDFKRSQGWLDKFKMSHRIRQIYMKGEKLSADSDVLIHFSKKFTGKIRSLNLTCEQVYTCSETGLN